MSFFESAPDIPKIGIAPSRLSKKEKIRRLSIGVWTDREGITTHISELPSRYMFNIIRVLTSKIVNTQYKNNFDTNLSKQWVDLLMHELSKREDDNSKHLVVLLKLTQD